jgi:hypothetical protein
MGFRVRQIFGQEVDARFVTTPFSVSKFSANHPAAFFFVKMCVAWP